MDSTLIAPPWPSSRNESDANVPKSVKRFYRGEPLALGITQILLGTTHIAFGVVINLTGENRGAYIAMEQPVWAGILYIISGSLSVAAARNPKVPMVKGMLGMNVNMLHGIMAVFLVFNIVEFCITISTAAFGCKTVCQDNYTETVVVVYQNVTPGDAPAACKDPNSP